MNSTAAIFDFVNVPTLEVEKKLPPSFLLITIAYKCIIKWKFNFYKHLTQNYTRAICRYLYYLLVFILFVGIYTICRYLYYLSVLTNDAMCSPDEPPGHVDEASLLDVMSQSGVLFSGQGAEQGWIDPASTRPLGIRVKTEIVGKR